MSDRTTDPPLFDEVPVFHPGCTPIIGEVRRRTQVVGSFPDCHATLMRVAARLRHVSVPKWDTRRYLDMDLPRRHLQEAN